MKPTPGRIVHYTNLGDKDGKYPPEIVPSMVIKVNTDGSVALKCFYASGIFDVPAIFKAPDGIKAGTGEARGMWQWPERD